MYAFTYSILISLISFLFFYVLGMLSLPKNFVSTPFFPTFVGAALFSLIIWYGIECSFSIHVIFQFIFLLGFILCLIRIKFSRDLIKNIFAIMTWKTFWKRFFFWSSAYILFYLLVYIFLPLPNPKEYLPLTRVNNFDIFNYVNITQDLLSTMRYNFWIYYYQTPAVFYFYAWMSLFYHNNAMTVAMPILYSTVSAIGLMIVFYCHHFFRCPRRVAVAIAAVILCGSFYRYIIGVYFLSSLMGTIVWLAFIIEILQWDFKLSLSRFWNYCGVIFIYECLLLLIYPVFFISVPMVFSFIIGLMLFFSAKVFSWRTFIKNELFFMACLLLPALLLFILMPGYFEKVEVNLFEFVHRVGVIGFSLLSPPALLGFPYFFEQTSHNALVLSFAFVLVLAGFVYAIYAARLELQPAAYTLLYLVIAAFVGYFIYYAIQGPTRYQPWKFASYFILPLTGVFWALAFRLKTAEKTSPWKFTSYFLLPVMGVFWALAIRLKPAEKGFIGLIIFCIVGNFLWVNFLRSDSLTKDYEKLSTLNTVASKDLYLNMSTNEATFLSVFFIRDKNLYLLGSSCYYYPQIMVKDVPKNATVFIESKHCKAGGVKIASLGCLYSGVSIKNTANNAVISK